MSLASDENGLRAQLSGMKARARGMIDITISNIPVATEEAAGLALDLSTRAQGNIESCKDNYSGRRYADSAEDLQQAVEKASKAFGLLTGTVRPTDAEMRAVGHDSFKAFVLHFWDFYPKLVALMAAESDIATSELLDNFVLRGVGKKLKTITEAMQKTIPPDDKIRAELAELDNLDPAVMWRASLDLDEKNKWIKDAVSGLKQKALISDNLQMLVGIGQSAVSVVKVFDKETTARTKLAAQVAKTGQKLFSLSLLTCWHLEPARYPPVGRYWNLRAYNASAPLVKLMPTLIKHTEVAVDSAVEASKMARIIAQGLF